MDYQILTTEQILNLAERYEYWQVKTGEEVIARKYKETGKGDSKRLIETGSDLEQTLSDIESDSIFPFAQVDFGSSPSSCKAHFFLVFNMKGFENWKKKKGLNGVAEAEAPKKTGQLSKVSEKSFLLLQQERKEMEAKIEAQKKEIETEKKGFEQTRYQQMREDLFAELQSQTQRIEAEARIKALEAKLEAEYQVKNGQLETSFILQNANFENYKKIEEIAIERKWEELEKAEEAFEKSKRIFAKRKLKLTETEEGNKNIAETIGKNLGSAAKSLLGNVTGLGDILSPKTENTPQETPKPKKDFSEMIKNANKTKTA